MNTVALTRKWCGFCPDEGVWKINPPGGYGRPEMWACTACLKGVAKGCVPRLMESYPAEDAEALKDALAP